MKRAYIWGTGKIAGYIYHFYRNQLDSYKIVGFIDNDKIKEGETFGDQRIYQPTVLNNDRDCYILILTMAYQEIQQQILESFPWMEGRIESPMLLTKSRILSRYKEMADEEIKDVLRYLENHSLQVFNYDFTEKYKEEYEIFYDEQARLFYTLFENKRMYFAKFLDSEEKVCAYCRQIMMEQDMESPHRYCNEDYMVERDNVVIDAGAAEGNFSLSVVEKVKKIYLFEPNIDWVTALSHTFAPYRDKVVIVNKYLSNFVDGSTESIDHFVSEKQVDFIKMDIEGEEYYAIDGAKNKIASSAHMKCVVCTYHHEFDYVAITQLLRGFGFSTEPSKGYMWFPYDRDNIFDLPTLRRGLIRACKQK